MAKQRASRTFMDCSGKGCEIKKLPGVFSPKTSFDFNYTTAAKPCGTGKALRKTCPVQFFFKNGKPKLRFCLKTKTPGYTVDVSGPAEAQRIAKAACKCWKETGSFDKCDVVNKGALGKLQRAARPAKAVRRRRA